MGIAIGVVAVLAAVAVTVAVLRSAGGTGGAGSGFPPGTKAWEAEMTLLALESALAQRRSRRAAAADEAARAKLDRQVAFLEAQRTELQRTIEARDLSPGRGYIGFQAPPED